MGLGIDISMLGLQLMLLPRPKGEAMHYIGMQKNVLRVGSEPTPPLQGAVKLLTLLC